MKVHILSLQRTGSKSLQQAVHNALDDPLESWTPQRGGSNLGEFFHGWESHGYKFGHASLYPFDPDHRIMFRTHPEFADFSGRRSKSFIPVIGVGEIHWQRAPYVEQLAGRHVAYRRVLLDQFEDRNYVVKTQLATLAEDIQPSCPIAQWMPNVVDGFDLTLNLVPDDLVKWVCSNFLADETGVFVPCPEQEEARYRMKDEVPSIPQEYVTKLVRRLELHHRMAAYVPNAWMVTTSALSHPGFAADLSKRMGLAVPVVITHEKEFSVGDYADMIANYEDLPQMIAAARQEQHVILDYPL